jgi:hypothetical protein
MIALDGNQIANYEVRTSSLILSFTAMGLKLLEEATQLPSCLMLILASLLFSGQISAESRNIQIATGRHWHASASEARMLTVTKDGDGLCNSVSFSQIPGHLDLFVGRLKENTGPDKCSGNNWAIALFEMNWDKRELRFVRYILRPPFSIPGDGRVIQSVYDAYAIEFNDEIWIAFECASPESVSSCVAPLDLQNGVAVARVSAPVSGGPKTNTDSWRVSASDPKLLLYRRHLYLYWTVIRSDDHGWIDGTTRGVELGEDLHEKRLWVHNSIGQPVRSSDRRLTTEVWSPTPSDASSDSFIDVFDIFTNGKDVFAIAALGGHGESPGEKCLTPGGSSFGCFRLVISKALDPLRNHIFNNRTVDYIGFPENPQEYSRVVQDPNGKLFMMGTYLDPPEKYVARYQELTRARGLMLYPISVD